MSDTLNLPTPAPVVTGRLMGAVGEKIPANEWGWPLWLPGTPA